MLVACLLVTSSCHLAFDLEEAEGSQLPAVVPVQEVGASLVQPGPIATLTFAVEATAAGNTLVLVIAVKATAERIETVFDDGGNVWSRALDGADSLDLSRLEIWNAPDAKPITGVGVTMIVPRSLAVSFTEWDAIAAIAGSQASAPTTSSKPATGPLELATPALVVAATAFTGSQITAIVDTSEFTALDPFRSTDDINGSATFAVVAAGSHEVTWSLPSQQTWTAGAVGFRLRE